MIQTLKAFILHCGATSKENIFIRRYKWFNVKYSVMFV